MKLDWSERSAFIAGLILIAVTNAVALGAVVHNRFGEPKSVLSLTERELQFLPMRQMSRFTRELDLADMHLHWRVRHVYSPDDDLQLTSSSYTDANWLEAAQLRELGYEVPDELESPGSLQRLERQRPRQVLLVLEYDGPAYHIDLARARKRQEQLTAFAAEQPADDIVRNRLEDARRKLDHEERYASRLFVVDAGADERALRARYPDRGRYAFVPGRLRISYGGQPGQRRLFIQVADIAIDTIRVPSRHRSDFAPMVKYTDRVAHGGPRYAVTVSFGQRSEPWISDFSFLPPVWR